MELLQAPDCPSHVLLLLFLLLPLLLLVLLLLLLPMLLPLLHFLLLLLLLLLRDRKLTRLLCESLGNINCHTTMIFHVSDSASSYMETLTTVQLASRIHRTRNKSKVGPGPPPAL